MESNIMKTTETNATSYKNMNACSKKGNIVILGSDYMADIPFNELGAQCGMGEIICNRSTRNENITQVLENLDDNIIALEPSKVFVNLGEADLKSPSFDVNEFISKYEWLLYQIHSKTRAKLFVVSVISTSPEVVRLNTLLKRKAVELGCIYIDLDHIFSSTKPQHAVFNSLKPHMRKNKIGFYEAMNS